MSKIEVIDLLGEAYPKRVEYIQALTSSDNKPDGYYPVKFRNSMEYLPVYRIPINFVKYRLNNGRTLATQQEYLKQNSQLPQDLFEKDAESIEAQLHQHQILAQMLGSEETDLIKLFKEDDQTESLIIDREGFLINGNRRKCAMTEVYCMNPKRYQKFEYIHVAILPVCTEEEKDQLEAQLQIKKDVKLKYDWVTEAFLFKRRQKDNHLSEDALKNYFGSNEENLKERIAMLEVADKYLMSRGWDKEYSRVKKEEFSFRELLRGKKSIFTRYSAQDADIFENTIFILLDNKEKMSLGRMYKAIQDMARNYQRLKADLVEEMSSVLEEDDYVQTDMDVLLGQMPKYDFTQSLAEKLNNLEEVLSLKNGESITVEDIVKEVVENILFVVRTQKQNEQVLESVKRANTLLQEAVNIFDNETITAGIRAQLAAILQVVERLEALVIKHDKTNI